MVQLPVNPAREWVIYGGRDTHEKLHRAMEKEARKYLSPLPDWDEDIAKCMLWMHIKEGGVLSIKREPIGRLTIAMDGRIIKSISNDSMITDLITPLIDKLAKEVHRTVPSISDKAQYLPGITKIKIKRLDWLGMDTRVRYTLNHKLGKDGGRNYHFIGSMSLNGSEMNYRNII